LSHIVSDLNYDRIFFDEFGKHAFPTVTKVEYRGMQIAADARCLFKEAVAEEALANCSEAYTRISGLCDFSDQSDCKTAVSQRRNNVIKKGVWTHSIQFTDIAKKPGGGRLIGFDRYNNDWYYLAVPYNSYCHLNSALELILERFSNTFTEPKWSKTNTASSKWLEYRVDSFDALAKHKF